MNRIPVHGLRRHSPLWLLLPIFLILACTCNLAGAATPTPAPYPPTYTPYPTYTPAVAPTEAQTPVSGATLLINQNANCRSGPGIGYGIADTLYQGQTVPIIGRNDTNTWFEVKRPTGDGFCWVSAISVTAQGNLNNVAIISVPTPVDTEVPANVKGPKASPTFASLQGIFIVKSSPTLASLQGIFIVKPSPTHP